MNMLLKTDSHCPFVKFGRFFFFLILLCRLHDISLLVMVFLKGIQGSLSSSNKGNNYQPERQKEITKLAKK